MSDYLVEHGTERLRVATCSNADPSQLQLSVRHRSSGAGRAIKLSAVDAVKLRDWLTAHLTARTQGRTA